MSDLDKERILRRIKNGQVRLCIERAIHANKTNKITTEK